MSCPTLGALHPQISWHCHPSKSFRLCIFIHNLVNFQATKMAHPNLEGILEVRELRFHKCWFAQASCLTYVIAPSLISWCVFSICSLVESFQLVLAAYLTRCCTNAGTHTLLEWDRKAYWLAFYVKYQTRHCALNEP